MSACVCVRARALFGVVDYAGWRVLASALLPIGEGTLVYGSADGGRTVSRLCLWFPPEFLASFHFAVASTHGVYSICSLSGES